VSTRKELSGKQPLSRGAGATWAARLPWRLRARAPISHDRQIVEDVYGGRETVDKLLGVGDAAEAAYRGTGTQEFVPAASRTDTRAIMFGVPYYTDHDRGLIAEWPNQADLAFWRGWLTFDAIEVAPEITQPFLIVHSEAAAIPKGARLFFARAKAPKQEVWLQDVSQFDFYDRPSAVTRACDAVAAHFRRTLLPPQE
jgi:uncharacterized protein